MMRNLIAPTFFAITAIVSAVIWLVFHENSRPVLSYRTITVLAGLSAFIAASLIGQIPWSRISAWPVRAGLFGFAVVLAAHLLFGVFVYFYFMGVGGRPISLGAGLFILADTWTVTAPFGIAAALILEYCQKRKVN